MAQDRLKVEVEAKMRQWEHEGDRKLEVRLLGAARALDASVGDVAAPA
jgi:hypothetical protein